MKTEGCSRFWLDGVANNLFRFLYRSDYAGFERLLKNVDFL